MSKAHPGIANHCWCGLAVAALPLVLSLAIPGARPSFAQGASEAPPAIPDTVRFRELQGDGQTLWLYLPKTGTPCGLVAIAPAGGTLLTAPELAPADRSEHLPYAQAGFAVVSFSLSGTLTGSVTPDQVRAAMADFAKARDGVSDARRAIDAAIAAEPALANKPLVAAGHSSAANLAIDLAAEEPRVRALIAYAPVADTMKFIAGGRLEKMAADIPGSLERAAELSPLQVIDKIGAPVFLFHAEGDDVAPIEGTRELESKFAARKHPARVLIAPSGGHTDAMFATGIPAAVSWLRETLACPVTSAPRAPAAP